MAADTVKSASITNLDAVPFVPNTTGEGGPGYERNASDYAAVTTGGLASTASTYKMVRLPSNAKVKRATLKADADLDSNASPTLKVDVGAYYSDATMDGTQVANQGVLISANAFAAAVLFGKGTTDTIDALAAFTAAKKNQPLWQALGLASDPGGFIDVVVAVNTVAATAVAGVIGFDLTFVD